MPRAAPSQSQRYGGRRRRHDEDDEEEEEDEEVRPTQSQKRSRRRQQEEEEEVQPTQSQKRGKRPQQEEEEEEDEDDEENLPGATQASTTDDLKSRANDLVRLALLTEGKRGILRRDEINKKVMGPVTRQFPVVFKQAQATLRDIFGMEMVELMTKTELDKGIDENMDEDTSTMTGARKKTAASSKNFVLRSILDPALIEASALFDPELRQGHNVDDDDDDDTPVQTDGSMVAWQTADQLPLIGILHVVLGLILMGGKTILEGELKAYLKSLHLRWDTKLDLNHQSTSKTITLEAFLNLMIRQNYLDRQRSASSNNATQQPTQRGKRSRAAADDPDEEAIFEWRWGSRAHAEIGEQGIAEFMVDFMTETWVDPQAVADEDQDEEQDQPSTSTGRGRSKKGKMVVNSATRNAERAARAQQRKETYSKNVMRDIVRGAGGKLTAIDVQN